MESESGGSPVLFLSDPENNHPHLIHSGNNPDKRLWDYQYKRNSGLPVSLGAENPDEKRLWDYQYKRAVGLPEGVATGGDEKRLWDYQYKRNAGAAGDVIGEQEKRLWDYRMLPKKTAAFA